MKLLSEPKANPKINKGNKKNMGWLGTVLHLAPYKLSGYQTCPSASAGCAAACLNTAGYHARLDNTQNARIRKTKQFFEDRIAFKAQLLKDIASMRRKALKASKALALRLNATSDIRWEQIFPEVFDNQDIQFYDYTKIKSKAIAHARGELPVNYHITFSRSENNWADCLDVLNAGGNVAVVFKGDIPNEYEGFEVVLGDDTDWRFLDSGKKRNGKGLIIALTAKGEAKTDDSGFVVDVNN